MFGLGIMKGTIIGIGLGVIAGLLLNKNCKKKKSVNNIINYN